MVLMLQWLGLDTSSAAVVALLFRVINYWSIVVLGVAHCIFNSAAAAQAATD